MAPRNPRNMSDEEIAQELRELGAKWHDADIADDRRKADRAYARAEKLGAVLGVRRMFEGRDAHMEKLTRERNKKVKALMEDGAPDRWAALRVLHALEGVEG